METVEMDLMQAQIGSLATDVSRLEAKVANNSGKSSVYETPDNVMAAATASITAAVSDILTAQKPFSRKNTMIADITQEQLKDIIDLIREVYRGGAPTVLTPGSTSDIAYKIICVVESEDSAHLTIDIPTYHLVSPLHDFHIYLTIQIDKDDITASVTADVMLME